MRADGEQQSAALKEFAAVNTLVQLTSYKVEVTQDVICALLMLEL